MNEEGKEYQIIIIITYIKSSMVATFPSFMSISTTSITCHGCVIQKEYQEKLIFGAFVSRVCVTHNNLLVTFL